MVHILKVTYLKDYTLWVEFDDGIKGTVDLSDHLTGEMFEPLKDKKVFGEVVLDAFLKTIVWPNGADLAPEFLREHVEVADA